MKVGRREAGRPRRHEMWENINEWIRELVLPRGGENELVETWTGMGGQQGSRALPTTHLPRAQQICIMDSDVRSTFDSGRRLQGTE